MGRRRQDTLSGKNAEYNLSETLAKDTAKLEKKAARQASRATRAAKFGKFMSSGVGKAIGGGVMGGAMAGIGYLADGSFTGTQAEKVKAGYGTAGAVAGGLLGGLLTPFIGSLGPIIGSELGKWGGEALGKVINKGRAKRKTELEGDIKDEKGKELFSNLSDNYSKRELAKLQKIMKDGKITESELNGLKPKTLKKLAKNDSEVIAKLGDKGAKAKINKEIESINAKIEEGRFNMETGSFNIGNADFGAIEPIAMASGGKLEGPSDINGPGMPIQGTNIIVGGGEYVVNRDATAKNERLLDAINAGATFKMANGGIIPTPTVRFENGGVIPVPQVKFDKGGKLEPIKTKISNILPSLIKNPMAPLKVAANQAKDFVSDRFGGVDKMEVAPIKLDVSGTIKLDSGGQQVDLNAIINNPAFLTQLSQMIERRLSDNINGGNFKELRKNKRHTF